MSTQHELRGPSSTGRSRPPRSPDPATASPPLRPADAARRWQRHYVLAVHVCDLTIVAVVVAAGLLLRIGSTADVADHARASSGAATGLLVVAGLAMARVWDEHILGNGPEELRRMARAFSGSGVVVGLGGLALQISSVRPWVFGVLPLCAALCLLSRYALRRLLHRRRGDMRCMLPVLAVGSHEFVADLIHRTRRDPHYGWRVTGVCTPTGTAAGGRPTLDGVPVVGDLDAVAGLARRGDHRIVAVAPAPGWGPPRLHRLAWELEGTGTELAVDPGLVEVAGPLLHITPVDGLPLLRLSKPRLTGTGHLVKDVLDRAAAAVLLVLLALPLLVLALVVWADGGPALTVQERLGLGGRTFRMLTFRTTVHGNRSRPTRAGTVLRRHALDELPQLVNVLTGAMSLVGPRPTLTREVDLHGTVGHRGLQVKPGMTGLSQISGRGKRTLDERVRLDLRYVQNWSAALDVSILWRSLGAMVRGRGVL